MTGTVRGTFIREVIRAVETDGRRHEDDAQLVPGHREFHEENYEAHPDVPPAQHANAFLDDVHVRVLLRGGLLGSILH